MSNFLRGQLKMLDDIMELRNVFDRFDKLEKTVKDAEKSGNKGAE